MILQYLSESCVRALLSLLSRYPSSPPSLLPPQKPFHVWTSTMAADARIMISARVDRADIAGTRTSSKATDGGLGSLGARMVVS